MDILLFKFNATPFNVLPTITAIKDIFLILLTLRVSSILKFKRNKTLTKEFKVNINTKKEDNANVYLNSNFFFNISNPLAKFFTHFQSLITPKALVRGVKYYPHRYAEVKENNRGK